MKYDIAIVTDIGFLMDGGFNQGTYEGVKEYCEKYNKTFKHFVPANGDEATDGDRIAAMNSAVESGAKIVVLPGFAQQAALEKVAPRYPEVKFVGIDVNTIKQDNVTGIHFKEEQSGFLAGYAAIKDGYTSLGGTFGGGGSDLACNRYAYGYVQGIKKATEETEEPVKIKISYLYGNTFGASVELQTQMAAWYARGTEIIFSCGGSMLQSVKAAASETLDGMIIGVDSDQHKESDRILTSALKKLKPAIETVLNVCYAGGWDQYLKNKDVYLGVTENAVGLPTENESWRFDYFSVDEYTDVFNEIVSGEIVVDNSVPSNANNKEFWEGLSTEKVTIKFE